jgi:hypothetical protein
VSTALKPGFSRKLKIVLKSPNCDDVTVLDLKVGIILTDAKYDERVG